MRLSLLRMLLRRPAADVADFVALVALVAPLGAETAVESAALLA